MSQSLGSFCDVVIPKLPASGSFSAFLPIRTTKSIWYGGKTRNPWNIQQGSSGSSAGPAAAVAAGLVAFAIGSETQGSIVSPATVCGVTGLRPTFGRVSRSGAMTLSWSMDKLGPMARTVEDCALVFNAIYGPDGKDLSVKDLPFNYDPTVKLKSLRVGYLKREFEEQYPAKATDSIALAALRSMGVKLIPMELPEMHGFLSSFILSVEAAAAFEDLTLSNRDDLMVRQGKQGWPNLFRAGQVASAVQYIQANRIRTQVMEQMAEKMKQVDVYLAPSLVGPVQRGTNLRLTNLTGHPCVTLPNGFSKEGTPLSITFVGQLYGEATLLAAAKAYQDATGFHKKHPKLE